MNRIIVFTLALALAGCVTTADLDTLSASLGFSLDEMRERLERGDESTEEIISDTRAQLVEKIQQTQQNVETRTAQAIETTRQDGLFGLVGVLAAGAAAYARRNQTRRRDLHNEIVQASSERA